ncbi:MAG: M48 family metalloprotease [Candidatus Aminicenantes bacterium]|nr:M48 family metalloprotease [Candidatus Aminicenantes bacterium]
MNRKRPRNFYEIQRQQQWKSLFILAVLMVFYFLAIGMIAMAVFLSIGAFAVPHFLSGSFLAKLMGGVLVAASVIAVFHYHDARRFGAAFILKRLDARNPDPADRYHLQLANTVEEMRVASGLPAVRPYVIPSFAVNSMALIEADGVAAVAVTEGLLADCTRDEIQAVAAHELAHIARGDAFYVGLVCSLANFLEKLRAALEPDDSPPEDRGQSGGGGAPPVLIYAVLTLTSILMHLLSTMLSREREILADAAASEISRNPVSLARALYKAHLKSSFVGDFSLTYSPLFIVAPALSSDDREGFWSRLFNSHPPLMKRVRLLAQQAGLRPAKVIEQVWESRRSREQARGLVYAAEEKDGAMPVVPGGPSGSSAAEQRVWEIKDTGGRWQGPFSLEELLFLPSFSVFRKIGHIQEDVVAQAREFPQVRLGLENLRKKKPVVAAKQNRCPRCHVPLNQTFYEGVAIQACRRCGGKLVDASLMDRIIVRREVTFSEVLISKARAFREEFLLNPIKKQRAKEKEVRRITCPHCGYRMLARPYSYQYFVPVDKCLACAKIWFDADELEILQILIEKLD